MRIHFLFTSMLVALSGAAAQEPPSETIKADVTMIQVPVIVRDHDGHVVGNLGKDDFQLFDNGNESRSPASRLRSRVAGSSPTGRCPRQIPRRPRPPRPETRLAFPSVS